MVKGGGDGGRAILPLLKADVFLSSRSEFICGCVKAASVYMCMRVFFLFFFCMCIVR